MNSFFLITCFQGHLKEKVPWFRHLESLAYLIDSPSLYTLSSRLDHTETWGQLNLGLVLPLTVQGLDYNYTFIHSSNLGRWQVKPLTPTFPRASRSKLIWGKHGNLQGENSSGQQGHAASLGRKGWGSW